MSYDPALGRWLETDPEQYVDGPNLYQMELGNPVALLDPSGEAATTQPSSLPTTQPGNTWDLFGPGGGLSQGFIDNYITSHNWGRSGPPNLDMPPYDPCGDGTFRPRVGINTRHDMLRIGDTSKLTQQQISQIQGFIDKFNQVSAEHEAQIAQALKDIYCSCSSGSGSSDWNRRVQAARALSSTSDLERKDMYNQLSILEQILNAAGIPIPSKLRNDLKFYTPK